MRLPFILKPSAYLPAALHYFGQDELMEHPKTPMIAHLANKLHKELNKNGQPEASMAVVFGLAAPQFFHLRPTEGEIYHAFGTGRTAIRTAQTLVIPSIKTIQKWRKKYPYVVNGF